MLKHTMTISVNFSKRIPPECAELWAREYRNFARGERLVMNDPEQTDMRKLQAVVIAQCMSLLADAVEDEGHA